MLAKTEQPVKICQYCGGPITSTSKKSKQKYCSRRCVGKGSGYYNFRTDTKRRCKINPQIVRGIMREYMRLIRDRGLSEPLQRGDRIDLARTIAAGCGLTKDAVTKILRRSAWADIEVPADWVPFV